MKPESTDLEDVSRWCDVEAKDMNCDLFFYIGDSDCMDVLDLLDDAVKGLAKRCRAMDCIETYV